MYESWRHQSLSRFRGVLPLDHSADKAVEIAPRARQRFHVLDIVAASALVGIGIDPSITKLHLDPVISYLVGDNGRVSGDILVCFHQSLLNHTSYAIGVFSLRQAHDFTRELRY